jgi:hypothetical protein
MFMAKRFTGLFLGLVVSGMSTQAAAQRDLASVLAEISQGFVCPQFRPDDAARRADMLAFSRAIASVGPKKISYREAAYIHAKMLERHNCTRGGDTAIASAGTLPPDGAPPAPALGGAPN